MDIYTAHFGLSARPFTLVPDPDFMFWSPAHRRASAMLEYGVLSHAPITLITGEVGAGKTTLMQHFLRTLDEDVAVGLISNAHGDRGELLRWVLMSLDQKVPAGSDYVTMFAQMQDFLIEEYARGGRTILIFDEAQNLSRESLEELRMFTNINTNKDELLQLVLMGQPELRDLVRRPDLTQFAQRVAANFHLPAMDAPTVAEYVRHRLSVVGGTPEIFTDAALGMVHAATGGIPRLVNQLCDLAMLYAFEADQQHVDVATMEQVFEDGVFFGPGGENRSPHLVHHAESRAGFDRKVE